MPDPADAPTADAPTADAPTADAPTADAPTAAVPAADAPTAAVPPAARAALAAVPFADPYAAARRLGAVLAAAGPPPESVLDAALPPLLAALADAPAPDAGLVNFERFARASVARADKPPGALFGYLAGNPRAAEILVRLSVGSQYLTDILVRNPDYLRRLTEHRALPQYKSRADFLLEALAMADGADGPAARLDALRRYQHWELLRIGACDAFGLLDLKSVTAQLSLLADGFAQACLNILAAEEHVDGGDFCVLAFGKLGGEELNYSSDIDLAFLARGDATRFWGLGQKLIKALSQATGEGFLYRVDMRLRPWGRSGPLVNTPEAHLSYLAKHAKQWERQALLKARPIAGDLELGGEFLRRAEPHIYGTPPGEVRASVRASKDRIEANLKKDGREWGEVKNGPGGIRDVEFAAQCLQLIYGGDEPGVRSSGTLDALARLADRGLLWADEYRKLTAGYNFLRTVEHALQLRHHRQVHALPDDERELRHLARRLDFPDAAAFLGHHDRHRAAVRAVYEKYVVRGAEGGAAAPAPADPAPHAARMPPTYKDAFTGDEVARHAVLLGGLNADIPADLRVEPLPPGGGGEGEGGGRPAGLAVRLTVAAFDHPGDLAAVCGLLFARGWDVARAEIYCESLLGTAARRGTVQVYDLRPPPAGPAGAAAADPAAWAGFLGELRELLLRARRGEDAAVRAELAGRVAAAVRPAPGDAELAAREPPPPALSLSVDNDAAPDATVLRVSAADAPGLLYGLTNALALFGLDVRRASVRTVPAGPRSAAAGRRAGRRTGGPRADDTLFVTDRRGRKITDARRLAELRAAVGLVRQFTHLLPTSPDPRRALANFGQFLETLLRRDDWVEEVARLGRSEVLSALARLLGVSDFLWQDFLRLQHENLFPVLAEPAALDKRVTRNELEAELAAELAKDPADGEAAADAARRRLNRFKDRAMFRTDMRHILGKTRADGGGGFSDFAEELSDIAEVVIAAAVDLAAADLDAKYGQPRPPGGGRCPVAVCALGKCGGRELGFASDVELMVVYAAGGRTAGGPDGEIGCGEYFNKLVGRLKTLVEARRAGIFELDFRLRPYGRAGSPAVRRDTFAEYFAPGGPAWPYERQALVKLRPIAGDAAFGEEIAALRDELIYTGRPPDRAAVRAMREKQLRQLVAAGTVNAKLSPGGLVDVEYLVQILQLEHGRDDPELRTPGTLSALSALHARGRLDTTAHDELRDAYGFLRRLINALRVVRGNAKDLALPPAGTDEYAFLARRLGYTTGPAGQPARARLAADLDRHTARVRRHWRAHFGAAAGG